jgi:hypothetical protein
MIQLATRERNRKFLECFKLHVDTLSNENDVFFNISCDEDDASMNNIDTINSIHEIYENSFVNFNHNSSKVEAINANVAERKFDVLINSSDDMNPQIQGWDEEIRKGFEKYFPDYDGVLHFNDGFQYSALNTLCILGRPYYDRFRYIYYPGYKSLFCDNEFTEVSRKLNKQIYIDKTIIKHDHVDVRGTKNHGDRDATWRRAIVHENHDAALWKIRQRDPNLGLDSFSWYADCKRSMERDKEKFLSSTNICTVSDIKYLPQGLALYESLLEHTENFVLHYMCIDNASFDIIKNHQNESLIPYYVRDQVYHVQQQDVLLGLTGGWHGDVRDSFYGGYAYFCWSLASFFSNYLMNKEIGDITYVDSDVFFYDSFQKVLDAIGEKQVGVFRHRQFDLSSSPAEGLYNVGVVHFKNGEAGRKTLDWWADAVLYRKHACLATCGDQRYLDEFPMLADGNIFIDGDIGHGAPWQWQLYDMSNYLDNGIINWDGEDQKLIFTHFSQFMHSYGDKYVPCTAHFQYTPLQEYEKRPELKLIYDVYFEKVKEAEEKYF